MSDCQPPRAPHWRMHQLRTVNGLLRLTEPLVQPAVEPGPCPGGSPRKGDRPGKALTEARHKGYEDPEEEGQQGPWEDIL